MDTVSGPPGNIFYKYLHCYMNFLNISKYEISLSSIPLYHTIFIFSRNFVTIKAGAAVDFLMVQIYILLLYL